LGQRIQQAARQSSSPAIWSPQIFPDSSAANAITLPVNFGETAELMGYSVITQSHQLCLSTYWRAGDNIVAPLQMFVHAIGPAGSIEVHEDRLDASAFGWRSNDLIAQINHLALPDRWDQFGSKSGCIIKPQAIDCR
jgi:hypothetical protein